MPQKIKAILFDFDGVLRDSRSAIWQAFEHTLNVHGVKPAPSRNDLQPYIHHHKHVHREFANHVSLDDFLIAYDAKLVELWDTMKAYDGASEAVKQLHGKGYKIALVTSARRSKGLLADMGILEYFETIVGGNDTEEHKPHPEPVLLALARLGMDPDEAIMIGDMDADVLAAQAAGVRHTIAILDGLGTKDTLEAAGAEYIIDSVKDVVKTVERIEHES